MNINNAVKSLTLIENELNKSNNLSVGSLNTENTALIVVDMINGFVKSGSLADDNILKINEPIALLCKRLSDLDIKLIALTDIHTKNSTELLHYPTHCISGSYECRITDEIENSADILKIEKNSTNGIFSDGFQAFVDNNKSIDTFIIVGCCTDICVFQLATALMASCNEKNKKSRIIVVKNLCQTFNSPLHNSELFHITSLYNMKLNGIEIVNDID